MRNIFKDSELNLAFIRDGYVLIDALDSVVIQQLEEFYQLNSDKDFTGWHNSLQLDSPEQKARIDAFLTKIYDDHLSGYLDNYRAIVGSFISKKSDADGVVYLHRDWAFVEETAYVSLNLWLPLCETDASNGALTVLKGSHAINSQKVRGSGIPIRRNVSLSLAEKYLTCISMKPGQVLYYDHRLIHGSGINRSGKPRTAASIAVIPAETTPIHYAQTEAGIVELEVDRAFYHYVHLVLSTDYKERFRYFLKTEGYKSRPVEDPQSIFDEPDIVHLYEPRSKPLLRKFIDKLKAKTHSSSHK